MIDRILEAEVMDSQGDAEQYDAMDHAEVNKQFVADLLAFHGPERVGRWLDVGTGTGLIPIQLCQVASGFEVLGLDLAERMLEVGRTHLASAGFGDRIRLEIGDAKALPYSPASFEVVFCNTILHHLPDPAIAVREMIRVVKPGGTVFVRDLFRPDRKELLDQLVKLHAGNETESARQMFADSLHAGLTLEEIRAILQSAAISPDSVSMTSDRHWTWAWKKPNP